jgi:uroporphyrinogen decarboxylase
MRVNLHSCGSIAEILPDLIECGLEVLNPVQTSAAGMDIPSLKRRFGNDLVFWGGAYNPQLISTDMGYEEVFDAVRQNVRLLGDGGGFIFSGVHNLPATLPESHIRAMLDAWNAERNYRDAFQADLGQ